MPRAKQRLGLWGLLAAFAGAVAALLLLAETFAPGFAASIQQAIWAVFAIAVAGMIVTAFILAVRHGSDITRWVHRRLRDRSERGRQADLDNAESDAAAAAARAQHEAQLEQEREAEYWRERIKNARPIRTPWQSSLLSDWEHLDDGSCRISVWSEGGRLHRVAIRLWFPEPIAFVQPTIVGDDSPTWGEVSPDADGTVLFRTGDDPRLSRERVLRLDVQPLDVPLTDLWIGWENEHPFGR